MSEIQFEHEPSRILAEVLKPIPEINAVPVSPLFVVGSGRARDWIAGDPVANSKVNRNGADITFKTLLPVTSIEIVLLNPIHAPLVIEFQSNGETLCVETVADASRPTTYCARVNSYISAFRIKTAGIASLVQAAEILRVRPLVLTLDAYQSMMNFLDAQPRLRKDLESFAIRTNASFADQKKQLLLESEQFQARLDAAEAELDKQRCAIETLQNNAEIRVQELQTESGVLETTIEKLRASRIEVETELTHKESVVKNICEDLSAKRQKLNSVEDSIQDRTNEKDLLSTELATLKAQVNDWANKKNTFTAELSDVLGEYRGQAKVYIGLSVAILLLIAGLAYELLAGSAALLSAIKPDVAADEIWTYVATRMPFASVSIAILLGLLRWGLKPLLLKIFDIYDLRSLLQARVMLVTKVANQVAADMEMSREERSTLLVNEKMRYIETTIAYKYKSRRTAEQIDALMDTNSLSAMAITRSVSEYACNQIAKLGTKQVNSGQRSKEKTDEETS